MKIKNLIATVTLMLVLPATLVAGCIWTLTCFNDASGCTAVGNCTPVINSSTNMSRCYTNTALDKCCVCVYRIEYCPGGAWKRVIDYQGMPTSSSGCIIVPPSDHCGHNCLGWSPPGGAG